MNSLRIQAGAVTVARMVLAATLVMIICNTFRIPYAFLGGIYALLISRESPRATLSSAGTILLLAAAGVAYILVSVQFVISVPLLHFLWIIGSLFLAFYTLTVVTNYGAFVAIRSGDLHRRFHLGPACVGRDQRRRYALAFLGGLHSSRCYLRGGAGL